MASILRLTLIVTVCFRASIPVLAQQDAEDCNGQRYYYEVFEEVSKTTVQYGSNINVSGFQQDLFMDVYEPVGDNASARPAIVWAFGGAFIGGSREDSTLVAACESFARRGFVAVAIDYRLYTLLPIIPDSFAIADVVVKAVGDMKASIRYLRQDAATDNVFRVDTTRIIGAGASSGGIMAAHCAYLDENDVIPVFFQDIIENNGGLEGSSGDAQSLNHSSDIMAVLSLSGGIYRSEWMEVADPPIVSIHGEEDPVVPFDFGISTVPLFGFPLISMNGSGAIHSRADELGIDNYLVSVPGGGHEDIYFEAQFESYRDDFNENAAVFVYELLCPSIDILPSSILEVASEQEVLISPNPAGSWVLVEPAFEEAYRLELVDVMGRVWRTYGEQRGSVEIQRENLPSGMYFVVLRFAEGGVFSETLIFE